MGSYFGLIPSEHSSGGRQQLGRISKQGSSFLRFLLVEAGQSAARYDAELGRFYRRLAVRKHRALAKVAVARKLAMRLYLMLREDWNYAQLCRAIVQASPSHSVVASKNRPLEWAACLPEERGVRSSNHGSTYRRDGWWDLCVRRAIERTRALVGEVKTFLRERNGASPRRRRSVAKNALTRADVVRDRMTKGEGHGSLRMTNRMSFSRPLAHSSMAGHRLSFLKRFVGAGGRPAIRGVLCEGLLKSL